MARSCRELKMVAWIERDALAQCGVHPVIDWRRPVDRSSQLKFIFVARQIYVSEKLCRAIRYIITPWAYNKDNGRRNAQGLLTYR
jgi:hypothetical protein